MTIRTALSSLQRPHLIQSPLQTAFNVFSVAEIQTPNPIDWRINPGQPGMVKVMVRRGADEDHAEIQRDGDGRILCLFCSSAGAMVAWCEHIRFVASTGADAMLYAPATGGTSELGVLVPFVPSEGLFLMVTLRREHGAAMTTAHFTEISRQDRNRRREAYLGSLVPGEFGAKEIRTLLTDFLYGHLSDDRYFFPAQAEYSELSDAVHVGLTGKTRDELVGVMNAPRTS